MRRMTTEQGRRLRELRIKKGFERAADAARAYGWPVTTYQAHENGSRGLKLDAAKRYAKAFNSSVAFILTGGEAAPPAQIVNHVINVPLVGTVSGGVFREGSSLQHKETLVPAVPRPDIPASAQYCLRVEGPSVNLKIPDGAFAICARYDRFPGGAEYGQLVHVVREQHGMVENTIKEFRFDKKGAYLMPVSDHPDHQEPIRLNGDSDETIIRIEGVVIGKYEPM